MLQGIDVYRATLRLERALSELPFFANMIQTRSATRRQMTKKQQVPFAQCLGAQAIVKMIDISRASKQEKDDALKESKAWLQACGGVGALSFVVAHYSSEGLSVPEASLHRPL